MDTQGQMLLLHGKSDVLVDMAPIVIPSLNDS